MIEIDTHIAHLSLLLKNIEYLNTSQKHYPYILVFYCAFFFYFIYLTNRHLLNYFSKYKEYIAHPKSQFCLL